MRFLLDMLVSPLTAKWLTERGHDAVHALTLGLERAREREVLKRAANEGRDVVTVDTDFPRLLALSGEAIPGVILWRGGDYTQEEVERLLARVLEAAPGDTLARSICVVDRRSIRCRSLPIDGPGEAAEGSNT